MTRIHPSAVVDPKAELDDDVVIGPFCAIGPHVKIGRGTELMSHVVIENHTTLGRDNRVFHHAVLGGEPQDLKFRGEPATLTIGDHNDIREFVTMHIGTENGGGATEVGSHNLFMVGAHVAHDSIVADHCILANNVLLAGHITIDEHAVISGGAAIHHYVHVGRYAFVGGNSGVVHDCPPFMASDGHPARVRGVNTIGLQRGGFAPETIEHLKECYRSLYRPKRSAPATPKTPLPGAGASEPIAPTSQAAAVDALRRKYPDDEAVQDLCGFIDRAARGVHGRFHEAHRRDNKRMAAPR
jgi:UDP-N-acetylglucosamine acyltransferase